MMCDEDDLDLVVLLAEEPYHPEVEAPAYVLLELSHGAGYVTHGDDDRVRLEPRVLSPRLVTQVVVGDPPEQRVSVPRVPLDVLHHRASLIQSRHGSALADV